MAGSRHALFIHSAGQQSPTEGSGQFLAALRAGLGPEIAIAAPPMPNPDNPEPAGWEAATEAAIGTTPAPFALVGHSLGGSTILRHLALNGIPGGLVGVVIVAAPFWGQPDWDYDPFALPPGFADVLARLPALVLVYTRDDEVVPVSHAEAYARAIPGARLHLLDGRGHGFAGVPVDEVVAEIRALFG